jgi:hypothetical protein
MKEWMLPVFIVVVWIVQYILRNRENEEPVRAARAKPGDRPANRNPSSEIDRFLQEIERMKKKSAEERPEPPKANRAPLPKVLPTVAKPPRVRPVTPGIKARPADAESVPVIAIERVPTAAPAAAAIRSVGTLKPSPKPIARGQRPATAFDIALGLLRSPHSAASAIVLNEILSPPKCRRR